MSFSLGYPFINTKIINNGDSGGSAKYFSSIEEMEKDSKAKDGTLGVLS